MASVDLSGSDEFNQGLIISQPPEGAKAKDLGAKLHGPGQIAVPIMDKSEALAKQTHRGRPMALVSLPEGINADEFRTVLSATYMAYVGGANGAGTGAPPNIQEVMYYLGGNFNEARVAVIMGTKAFKAACEARGIATENRPGLTVEQDLALSIILDPSAGKSLTTRLKKAGVSMAKYKAWKKQPVFKAHLDAIGSSILKELETDMMVTLGGLGADGDLNAIKFAYEVTGRHDPTQKQVMNAQELVVQFIGIIQKHITDPELLQAVGNDLLMLASASGAAQAIKPTAQQPKLPEIEPDVNIDYQE